MTTPRVLVTGGSGFIGTNLIDLLLDRGAAVENWDVAPPPKRDHGLLWHPLDVCDAADVRRGFDRFRPTHVVHLAARTDLRGRSQFDYDVNIRGAENVLVGAEKMSSVEHILVASSRLVCRVGYQPQAEDDYAPDTEYGSSKVQLERLVRESRLTKPWTIVRPTSIWGPWFGTPYRDFFLAVAGGRYVHPKGVAVPKSFGFVGNTVLQLWELCRAPTEQVDRRTMYLADYEPIDVLRFATDIRAALMRSPVRTVRVGILRAAAAAGDILAWAGVREPPLTRFRLENLMTPMVYDLKPLRRIVGPVPYSTQDGIALTISWLRERRLV